MDDMVALVLAILATGTIGRRKDQVLDAPDLCEGREERGPAPDLCECDPPSKGLVVDEEDTRAEARPPAKRLPKPPARKDNFEGR